MALNPLGIETRSWQSSERDVYYTIPRDIAILTLPMNPPRQNLPAALPGAVQLSITPYSRLWLNARI